MRRMVLGSAVWVLVVSLAAASSASAQSPGGRRTRVEMPERLGPPIVVAPPDVNKAPAPSNAELGDTKPARPVPGSVCILLPGDTHWYWLFPAPHPIPIPFNGSRR